MIPNHVIQADFIAALKADAPIVAQLLVHGATHTADASIKEAQYWSNVPLYPGLRIKVGRQIPVIERGQCDHTRLTFSVMVFTEDKSSRECSLISGLVVDLFHASGGKFFRGDNTAGEEWVSYFRCSGYPSPNRIGDKLWRAEVFFTGTVYPAG